MRRTSRICALLSGTVVAAGLTVLEAPPVVALAPAAAPPPVHELVFAKTAGPEPTPASDLTDERWLTPHTPPQHQPGSFLVDVPASGRVRAGNTPLLVGPPGSGGAPARVRVRLLGPGETANLGGRFLAFAVERADAGATSGRVTVAVDYAAYERAFGGDFAGRLRLVERPSCATVRPQDAVCEGVAVVPTRNNLVTHTLVSDVEAEADPAVATSQPGTYESDSGFGPQAGAEEPAGASFVPDLGGGGTVMTLSSASSGQTGDYKATPFQPSNQWQVGVSSGGFSYGYPIAVPPPVAGDAPTVALNYSSQSVDGRTSSSHAQVSQVGQGWSFDNGYIERRFASCSDDGGGASNGDLCWSPNNEYFLTFRGHSDQIFRYGNTNEWRLRDDPAWRILSFTGAPNGDNDGEYFVVIEPDGTKHWFGSGTEAGGATPRYTNSTYTVPVTAGSTEPCYSAVSSASWCQQAWRWNVDRSQDTNENVISYYYAKETNYYLRAGAATATQYVRGGYPVRIEYGSRVGGEAGNDPAVVTIATEHRCAAQSACPAPTPATAGSYPDTPLDLMCTSAMSCSTTDHRSPSFFTTEEIKSVTTWVWNSTAYSDVATVSMNYSFPDHTDGTTPSLWLKDITRTGEYGTPIALPPVKFTGTLLANRVNYDPSGGVPATNKFRVGAVLTELGAKALVTYDDPYPCNGSALPQWDLNQTDCFPQWTTLDASSGWVAFRKYLVTQLSVDDTSGPSPTQTTQYVYLDAPAWHHDNSILSPAGRQSWSQYRGHAYVQIIGDPNGTTARTETRHMTFRGMNGDKLSNGTARVATLTDSTGTTVDDDHYLQGYPMEQRTYELGEGHTASKLHRYWRVATITGPAGWPRHDTVYVRESSAIDRVKDTASALGTWRTHEVQTTYDSSYAQPTKVVDLGDEAVTGDESCASADYTANVTTSTTSVGGNAWLVAYPYRSAAYSTATCGGTSPKTSLAETLYDGHALAAAPTDGNVTESWAYADAATKSVTKSAYDAYGRVSSVITPREVASGLNRATTTTYAPATGYPSTGVTVKNPLNHQATTKTSPAWGSVSSVTDANGFTTTVTTDALGRTLAVQKPGDTAALPSLKFDYALSQTTPTNVSTRRLIDGGRYVVEGAYLDGLGRVVQTETHEPNGSATGRLLTQTRYDAQGRTSAETDPFGNGDSLGAGMSLTQPTTNLETRYTYDSAGRRSRVARYESGAEQFATVTRHYGTWYQVDSPVLTDVDYRTDSWGRTWKITERPSGTTADTLYTYTTAGDLATITDDKNAVTSYTYDWLRRRKASNDPDAGVWLYGYDLDGNLTSTRDAKLQTLADVFDVLGRRTQRRIGSPTGTVVAEWTYDTLTNGVGRLTNSTRKVGTADYTTAVTGYDNRGRPTGRAITIPSGPHANTYAYAYGYDPSDNLTSVTMPAAGGLAQETLTTTYNNAGRPTGLTGAASYLGSTSYDGSGRLASRTINVGAVATVRTYGYDSVGRLNDIRTVRGTATVEDLAYTHDADGNVTSISDTTKPALPENECFRYTDGLNRLTRAWVTDAACSTGTPNPNLGLATAPYDLTYTYDSVGNMTSAVSTTASGTTTTAYEYTDTAHKHAARKIGETTYTYDANGSLVTASAGTYSALTWDETHQLASATAGSGSSTFVYDADGNRLLRTTGTSTTLYLDGMEIRDDAGTKIGIRYYGSVAMRTVTPTSNALLVLLRNSQNSTTTSIDSSGATKRQRYLPFGSTRGESLLPTERGYLDKVQDPTGLLAIGARYYDSSSGRFVSVDPLVDPFTPRTLAAYGYGLNNPVTMVDPSGLMAIRPEEAGAAGCEILDCGSDEATHQWKFREFQTNVWTGVPTRDDIIAGVTWTPGERALLSSSFFSSACFGIDRSGCGGNTAMVFSCQFQGGSDCQARARDARTKSTAVNTIMFLAMARGISKSMEAAAETFDPSALQAWEVPQESDRPTLYPSGIPNFKNPNVPPGRGWRWVGRDDPESGKGAWIKDSTTERLHPDLNHGPPISPHYDWVPYKLPGVPRHPGYRIYPDGTMELRT